jgi:hypothetical protein
MAKSCPADTVRTVEVVDLRSICIELACKHEFGKFAIACRWPWLRTSDAIEVPVKDARVATVGLEQDEGIC